MSVKLILSSSILLIFFAAAATKEIRFDESNPIKMVSDNLHELEDNVVQILGQSRHVLSFSRFAHRYGKKYQSVEEMKLRFSVFKENLDLIRSTNKKGLSYKLSLNQFADLTWQEFQRYKLLLLLLLVNTTGALEAAYHQAFGKGISLSEQQLVDCAGTFNNFGCHGGLPSQAFEYIKYNGGLDTEEAYPYTGKDGGCKFSAKNIGVQVLDSVNITLGAEDELKHAVGLVRPVSVAFEVVHEFRFYKKGVFTSNTCGNTPMDVNHAVLAVGYGVEDDVPYWLIKNSWGGDWGDNGYFKMEMGKNMCGVATCSSYPVVA
ncbi:hypothetical protein ARALYDRAFT_323209 [Arabidopsis lyrata subsp. lyrata]|uniref:cathepsin H n=1 Tax=Arabidopsis lyrata subsp. lyrata TaxID=81972 RepID=D7LNP3_ARALL|nr:hypothetical protein ARALYDRAFT_323209 [Arabidopsis lyrata subsp. lyrata]